MICPNDLQAFIKSRQIDENGVTTTVAEYGDEQVSREQTTGAGHNGVASGTQYNNGRQDGSSSRGQIGRVGDLSNCIQSPYFLAVIPTSMNYGR
jgi:hypothetical protein